MISVSIDTTAVAAMLEAFPRQATKAMSQSVDQTAAEVRDAIWSQMPRFFDRPTPYTLNSLRIETSQMRKDLSAMVYFKDPERMSEHYLLPQVEGTVRRKKGFELALGGSKLTVGKHQALDQYGNLSQGKLLQILSVLGKAERMAGAARNMTANSRRRSTKDRDYVKIYPGNKQGLIPGVYERFATGGPLAKSALKMAKKDNGNWSFQRGKRTLAPYAQTIRARGLRPVLLQGRQNAATKPRLPFYRIAQMVIADRLPVLFDQNFARAMNHV